MLKLRIAIVAIVVQVSSQVNAQYYEPADGQYYSTPSHHQYQQQMQTPAYHNNPHNVRELMDNEIFMNNIALRANVISANQQRRARMSPEQRWEEDEYWARQNCQTDRFVLGYATLGLYGLYSMMFNRPCDEAVAESMGETVQAGSSQITDLEKENAELRKKAQTLDDLSIFIRTSGMTQEEFTSWLEAMRVSREDPAKSEAIVKSILESPR